MNNLFEKGARWLFIILAVLAIIAIGPWFLPWLLIVKIILSVIFGLLFALVLFWGLFSSGPQ